MCRKNTASGSKIDVMFFKTTISLANTFFQVFFSFQGVYIDIISGLVGVTWVIDYTIVYHLLMKGIA